MQSLYWKKEKSSQNAILWGLKIIKLNYKCKECGQKMFNVNKSIN